MPSAVDDLLFNEPQGRRQAAIMFGSAIAFAGLYLYYVALGEGPLVPWLVPMVVGTFLAGVAESLPTDRRRAAGVLRLAAILVLLALVVVMIFSPDLLFGE